MKRKYKLLLVFIAILMVVMAALITGNMVIENKLESVLHESLRSAELHYEKLNASILGQSVSISNLVYKKDQIQITAEEIELDGIAIFEYLKNKNIEIGRLKLTKPEAIIYTEIESEYDSLKERNPDELKILIKSVRLVDGSLRMMRNDSVKEDFFIRTPSLNLTGVAVDGHSLGKKLPFRYERLEMTSDSLFFNVDDQHDMYVEEIAMDGDKLNIHEISIKPLYGKQEFQQYIPYEKDRFDINLDTLTFKSFSWGFENDSLNIKSNSTKLASGDLKIYRDKQVKDDIRQKPMYSEMIRRLPFKLKLDTFRVENLSVQYEELIEPKRGPGKVSFNNLNANIYNISNVNMQSEDFQQTNIDVQTQFMGEANLEVSWSFNISNKADVFAISGQLDGISSKGINQFMEPALNIRAEGGIRDMQFNFAGNNQDSTGDMKLVYSDFKIEVLREDGEEKNKLFSAIANLIVNKDATSTEKEQQNIKTKRDQTKSFWNYLWKNVRNAALKSFL